MSMLGRSYWAVADDAQVSMEVHTFEELRTLQRQFQSAER
jgi:hypothetical protein